MDNYRRVCELKDKEWNVTVIGIVKYYRPPIYIGKTGHHHVIINLIDESVQSDIENGIVCNMFADIKLLPNRMKIGDIVLLKRVRVTMYCGKLQIQRNNHFQWAVCETEERDGVVVVTQTHLSNGLQKLTSYEQLRLNELLKYSVIVKSKIIESELNTDPPQPSTTDQPPPITLLNNLQPDTYVNIIVKFIHVNRFVNASGKSLLITVSDGTQVSYNSLYQAGRVKTAGDMDQPDSADVIEACQGYTCRISVFDEHVDTIESLKVGDVILITNLHVRSASRALVEKCKEELVIVPENEQVSGDGGPGVWYEMIVHTGTKYGRGIKMADQNDERTSSVCKRISDLLHAHTAKKCMRSILNVIDTTNHEVNDRTEGMLNNEIPTKKPRLEAETGPEPNCLHQSLTTVEYPLKQRVSIVHIKRCKVENIRYNIRANVLSLKPSNLNDIIVGVCQKCRQISKLSRNVLSDDLISCRHCDGGDTSLKLTYVCRLLLEDETGLLEVVVCGDNATLFFNNTEPSQLLMERSETLDDMQRKLDELFDHYDGDTMTSSLPWVDVCVLSRKVNGVMKYFMFGTTLV